MGLSLVRKYLCQCASYQEPYPATHREWTIAEAPQSLPCVACSTLDGKRQRSATQRQLLEPLVPCNLNVTGYATEQMRGELWPRVGSSMYSVRTDAGKCTTRHSSRASCRTMVSSLDSVTNQAVLLPETRLCPWLIVSSRYKYQLHGLRCRVLVQPSYSFTFHIGRFSQCCVSCFFLQKPMRLASFRRKTQQLPMLSPMCQRVFPFLVITAEP